MRNYKFISIIFGLLLLGLVFVGCKDILISGTFIFVRDFDFTAQGGIYYQSVDITDDPDWEDHKDEIDFIDAVGLEFDVTNDEDADVTFDMYVDDYGLLLVYPTSIPGTATLIINGLVVPPGEHHFSYAMSQKFLTGIDRLKELAFKGQFNYFGESTGNDGSTFFIENAKIIVTLSASK